MQIPFAPRSTAPGITGFLALCACVALTPEPARAGRPAWESLGPPSRFFHSMALDDQRRLILIGGANYAATPGSQEDVWIIPLDSIASARRVFPKGLGPGGDFRRGDVAVFDPIGKQVLYVDPEAPNSSFSVWALKLTGTPEWKPLATNGALPPFRTRASVAFDAAGRRLFLFGGSVDPTYPYLPTRLYYNDIWVLNLVDTTWTEQHPSGAPPTGRHLATLRHEAGTDALILFGGDTDAGASDEVWTVEPAASGSWTQLPNSGPWPSPRFGSATAATGNRLFLHGGANASGSLGDTWEFTYSSAGGSWTAHTPPGLGPGSVAFAVADWDSATSSAVFYGGLRYFPGGSASQNRVTRLTSSASPQWLPLVAGLTPPPDRTGVAAYRDDALQRIVVLPGRDLASPDSGATIASAALGQGLSNWVVHVLPVTNPGPRWAYAHCLDRLRNRVLVFGGWNQRTSAPADSTLWALDLGTYQWSVLPTAGASPRGRADATFVYDPDHDRAVLFGGTARAAVSGGDTLLADLWSLDLSGTPTWAPISPAGQAPIARDKPVAVLDRARRRMLLLGRPGGPTALDNLWSLDLNTPAWTPLTTTGSLFGFCLGAAAVVDSARDQLFLIGSACAGTMVPPFVASLNLATLAWTRLEPAATPVRASEYGSIVPDPARDRYLLVGGGKGDPDPWAFRPDADIPPRIELVRQWIDDNPNGQFVWASPDRSAMHATLYRSIDGGPWISLGPKDADPRGVFTHLEPTIGANVVYDYRFGVMDDGVEVFVGQTRLVGYPTLGFSIGAFPNPATSLLHIRYSVPVNSDVRGRIELYDIGGRRLRWLELPVLGRGVYTMDLGAGLNLKPGVYFVRLTQRPNFWVTSRVVILQ